MAQGKTNIEEIKKEMINDIQKALMPVFEKHCSFEKAFIGKKIGNMTIEDAELDGTDLTLTLGLPPMKRIEIKGVIK